MSSTSARSRVRPEASLAAIKSRNEGEELARKELPQDSVHLDHYVASCNIPEITDVGCRPLRGPRPFFNLQQNEQRIDEQRITTPSPTNPRTFNAGGSSKVPRGGQGQEPVTKPGTRLLPAPFDGAPRL